MHLWGSSWNVSGSHITAKIIFLIEWLINEKATCFFFPITPTSPQISRELQLSLGSFVSGQIDRNLGWNEKAVFLWDAESLDTSVFSWECSWKHRPRAPPGGHPGSFKEKAKGGTSYWMSGLVILLWNFGGREIVDHMILEDKDCVINFALPGSNSELDI